MNNKKRFCVSAVLLVTFLIWTIAVCIFDVRPIGPQSSEVGFATINKAFHELTGVHLSLYYLTDMLSLIPLGICVGFGVLGLCQWIQRKRFFLVDRDLLILGLLYLAVIGCFLLFEITVINYRPILINGALEASYPSSTTLLVLCVMISAMNQAKDRVKNKKAQTLIIALILVFTIFMVLGRMISGVHWLTDIIGGMILSAGLILLYNAMKLHFCSRAKENEPKK